MRFHPPNRSSVTRVVFGLLLVHLLSTDQDAFGQCSAPHLVSYGASSCDTAVSLNDPFMDELACDSFSYDSIGANRDECFYQSIKSCFADTGITFNHNVTQFYFGTVDGGLEQTGRYGGHGDYLANLDLGKLGVHEGLFLKVRAEHRFGRSMSEPTGALLGPTLAADLPVVDSRDLYLTNVLFTQFLTERVAVFAGKLDSLDGDFNAYASGRGITQFSNTSFIANPIALRTVPYSTLGCGFAIIEDGEPLFNFIILNPTDTADSDGFDELFAEGVTLSSELRLATNLFRKPGHQLFGATWSSREYTELGQDPRVVLPNIPIERTNGSWSCYWNTDQALWVDSSDPSRHFGYFARAGIADDSSNAISYLLSAGLGGASPLRQQDSFGAGYFYLGASDSIGTLLETLLGPIDDSQGCEVFYRTQVTSNLSVTPGFQWIDPARRNVSDAYLLGVRANLQF